MSRPKLPDFTTVIALAEQTDCRVSLIDLARMHKHSEYSEQAVDALWLHTEIHGRNKLRGVRSRKSGSALRGKPRKKKRIRSEMAKGKQRISCA